MRRRVPWLLGLAVSVLVMPGISGARSRPACPLHTGRRITDVVVGKRAVLYAKWIHGGAGYSFACDRRTGRRWRLWRLAHDLAGPPEANRLEPHSVAIGGRYAAWYWREGEADTSYSGLDIINVRTGEPNTVDFLDAELHYFRLALRPSGALAWSTKKGIFLCDACFDDSPPQVRRLAGPAGLRPRSLKTTRKGISWRQGGRERHRRLP